MAQLNIPNHAIDVILRVPSLFVLDAVLKNSWLRFLLPEEKHAIDVIIWSLLIAISSLASIFLFFLRTKHLVKTYKVLVSGLSICVSYYFNDKYIRAVTRSNHASGELSWIKWCYYTLGNLPIQILLGYIYTLSLQDLDENHMNSPSSGDDGEDEVIRPWQPNRSFRSFIYTVLLTPILCSLIGFPQDHLYTTPMIVFLIVMLEYHVILLSRAPTVAKSLSKSYKGNTRFLRNFGVQNFVELHWTRLHIPTVLRTFCFFHFVYHAVFVSVGYWRESDVSADTMKVEYNLYNRFSPMNYENLLKNPDHFSAQNISVSLLEKHEKTVVNFISVLLEKSLISGCDTVISLLGMTSVLSRVAHCVGLALSWFVQSNNEEDRSIGSMTAILFFILALQTGLTGMNPEQRLARLGRNLYLLTTAILHFIHGMINPILLNLSASQHHLPRKHVRPLLMCLFLMVFPIALLFYLWSRHTVGTWLLAVTAFSIEVVIKVFLSLVIYTLFMIDAYKSTFWEGLDDCIYYIKALGNCIEFVFGIFLFCNGAWILVFESGGTIRAVMMCIHAYFNIWGQAKEGWKTFIRRRSAVSKIESLPMATQVELEDLNDVCAICYQELKTARITRCRHYFHGVCLRKWLYVQDACPLCHETVYANEPPSANMQQSPPPPQRNPQDNPADFGGDNLGFLHNIEDVHFHQD